MLSPLVFYLKPMNVDSRITHYLAENLRKSSQSRSALRKIKSPQLYGSSTMKRGSRCALTFL
jgi:hypothetical protein